MGLLDRIRRTPPPPVPADGEPLSLSGRGHVNGFLQMEELNIDLVGRQGLATYDRMYRTDGDVKQVMSLVMNPIIAGTWEVEPAGGSNATKEQLEDAEFVAWALFENMAPNLRGHLQEALPVLFRSGFCPFEKVWEYADYVATDPDGSTTTEKVTTVRSLQLRLPRTIYRWKQDAWGGLEAVEQYLPVPKAQVVAGPNVVVPGNPVLTGPDSYGQGGQDDSSIQDYTIVTDTRMPDYRQTVWLPMSNLLYYRVGAEGDNWEGVSLLRPAYKHWMLKDAIERMDAIAQEREALGTPVCYPPLGATPDQFDAMEQILMGLRTNSQGYIVMPGPKATGTSTGPGYGQGWLLEFLSPGHAGTGRDPQPSLRYHTDKIAAAFIAEFVRLGHSMGGGSRATAQVQQDPFLVGVEAFAGLIEDVLNEQLVAPLMAYNRPNAKVAPRLKMSLVDATTLSQLADFILKLTQVGALLPDQTLEDFLRARGDLPPSDPVAIEERGNTDDALRREILMGRQNQGTDPGTAGGSAPKPDAGEQDPSTPSSSSDTTGRAAASGDAQLAADPAALTPADNFSPYMPGTERVRWRPQAFYELSVDLDAIEDHMDSRPQHMRDACGPRVTQLARQVSTDYPKRCLDDSMLEEQMSDALGDSYGFGQQTVSDEIERLNPGCSPALSLGKAMGDPQAIARRAKLAHLYTLDQMHHAVSQADLLHGADPEQRQRAAEKAGHAALRHVAQTHAVAAFNHGRHDAIQLANDSSEQAWGVCYTAILDKNTCGTCREADDGTVRSLDDPVRLANRPPNAHCESNASGRNMCRCFEIPALMEDSGPSDQQLAQERHESVLSTMQEAMLGVQRAVERPVEVTVQADPIMVEQEPVTVKLEKEAVEVTVKQEPAPPRRTRVVRDEKGRFAGTEEY